MNDNNIHYNGYFISTDSNFSLLNNFRDNLYPNNNNNFLIFFYNNYNLILFNFNLISSQFNVSLSRVCAVIAAGSISHQNTKNKNQDTKKNKSKFEHQLSYNNEYLVNKDRKIKKNQIHFIKQYPQRIQNRRTEAIYPTINNKHQL